MASSPKSAAFSSVEKAIKAMNQAADALFAASQCVADGTPTTPESEKWLGATRGVIVRLEQDVAFLNRDLLKRSTL